MDLTAISLCQENNLPLIVFNMDKEDNLLKLVLGENVGTKVSRSELSKETTTN
jgi:uridylate kinase